MSFQHNNTLAKSEPNWGSVDKSSLPRVAFAEHGQTGEKSTWKYPHHHIVNGGSPDKNGVYTSGTMYLHKGGLAAAWSAANGGRSGQKASPGVKAHLRSHRRAIGAENMGSRPNRKLAKELLEKSLAVVDARDDLSLSIARKLLAQAFSKVSNTSANQQDDMQSPNSRIVVENPWPENDDIPVSTDYDNSPKRGIEMDPVGAVSVTDDENTERMPASVAPASSSFDAHPDSDNTYRMPRKSLYLLPILGTRELMARGYRI